ncbi:hypothetical protein Cni_G17726 [Canna indica]|uniref:Uncharacterized protein n=1 Tax=Canna indica TaxID=4628 RepID=A0AAQ3KHL1_9LILI|nr:hypothetical protein Cni_G17726 [Canna indica]
MRWIFARVLALNFSHLIFFKKLVHYWTTLSVLRPYMNIVVLVPLCFVNHPNCFMTLSFVCIITNEGAWHFFVDISFWLCRTNYGYLPFNSSTVWIRNHLSLCASVTFDKVGL